jgi:CRISPR-associated protein Cas5, N-terminal domain
MSSLKTLRLKIYQPQAHYRVPFTYQRRHTYPIPPYSTVIGLLCNVLGIRNLEGDGEPKSEDYEKLKNCKFP